MSQTSSSSSSLSEDLDSEVFGPLIRIPDEPLIQLAARISRKVALQDASSEGRVVTALVGWYRIVHIIQLGDVRLVIRVPATGWGKGWTSEAASAFRSQVDTLRFIAENTTIPVPQVYDIDTSTDNEIEAPYICMSFIPGRTVSSCWFNNSLGKEQLEDFRLRILTGLAQLSAQFAPFTFDKIGSLRHSDSEETLSKNSLVIGPRYDWQQNDDGSRNIVASGPFNTLRDYWEANVSRRTRINDCTDVDWYDHAKNKIVDLILPCFLTQGAREEFVLEIPDLSPENIMVNDEGTITGIFDWDILQTVPRIVGYIRYPRWITRDWDPFIDSLSEHSLSEHSLDELQRYRDHYNLSLGLAMGWKGDWKFSRLSHITEAIWRAGHHPSHRFGIFRKLISEISGRTRGWRDIYDFLREIGSDQLSEDGWNQLKNDLVRLVSQEPPDSPING